MDVVKKLMREFKEDKAAIDLIKIALKPYKKQERDCQDGPRNLGKPLKLVNDFYSFRFLHEFRRRYVFTKEDGAVLGEDTEDDDETLDKIRVDPVEKLGEILAKRVQGNLLAKLNIGAVPQDDFVQPDDKASDEASDDSDEASDEPDAEENSLVDDSRKCYHADRDQA